MAHTILDNCTGCGLCRDVCPVSAITGDPGHIHEINQVRCVDCNVCGMTCPVGCITNGGGAIVRQVPVEQRSKPILNRRTCALCMLCVDLCRFKAFHVKLPVRQGHMPGTILYDESRCVGCGLCAKECPVNAIMMVSPR
ncbi:MAG TPA: 4Fe-4S dicluster domain-containing protein [Deltaproteobacteria bacterium]|nr:4Fe-4S dicluster domain-containing protein [Deltaproteobacteria bacterium]